MDRGQSLATSIFPAEQLPKPHHRERVEVAVGEQLPFDLGASLRGRLFSDGFPIRLHGQVAIHYPFQRVMGEIRTSRREHRLSPHFPCCEGAKKCSLAIGCSSTSRFAIMTSAFARSGNLAAT